MATHNARSCPGCGAPLIPGQRFCQNCGTLIDSRANQQTERTPDSTSISDPLSAPTQQTPYTPPPPPPPSSSYQPAPEAFQQQPAPSSFQQPPDYARTPRRDSSGRVLTQFGCGVLVFILIILALCGGAGWFIWNAISNAANTSSDSGNPGSSNNNSSSSNSRNNTPVQTISKTVQLNQGVTYAGVKLTFKDAQQANFFQDDNSTSPQKSGVLRLNYREENPSSKAASYYINDVFRLQLPDHTSIVPLNGKYSLGTEASTSRDNWLDFQVGQNVDIKQLVLRIGRDNEAQIDLPLTGNADLGKYQDKIIKPNKQALYSGTTWTITQARTTLSYDNTQAGKGMIFVVVDVRIDNNSSTDFNRYYGDYIRLKAGDTTSSLTGNTTIPLGVPAGTNATGEAAFLVSQGSTSFTFVLLGTPGVSQQAEIPFQIQG
ncbi:MAG: zinc ribbon domain-containing protein [Ktedonobacteraceae bacterium]|nr:zinc ribbon domain-containing protein [Ktedonobacteraceae bacterium]MBO0791777.1 zinc ribbon domain-containing protein [Ktedonobacteraceae bacterium]